MAQVNRVYQPPAASQTFLTITPSELPNGCRTIEVDNGSGLSVLVYCDGALTRVVSPYIARIIVNTGGSWGTIQFVTTGTPVSTDILNIVAFDTIVVPTSLPSFGPFSWGGGSVPNHLVPVVPGDQFLAWQVDQFINLLTGVMTGQSIFIGGGGNYPANGTFVDIEQDAGIGTISNFDFTTSTYKEQWLDGNPLRLNYQSGGIISLDSAVDATGIATPTFVDYNVGARDLVIIANPGGVNHAVNLPSATGSGRLLWIKRSGIIAAGDTVITPQAGDLIDNSGATISLSSGQARLLSDYAANNWAILGTV